MTGKTLIVDDSLTVRMDLAEAFLAAGLDTLLAATAAETRKLLASENVALVILDVVLPDADGLELLQEIRARDAPPPVLLLSTESDCVPVPTTTSESPTIRATSSRVPRPCWESARPRHRRRATRSWS
jgi:DNA-binding NtrC family response regulator